MSKLGVPLMDNWDAIAEWAEFRAQAMRHDADLAERLVGNPPSFAYAASLRKAADIMEEDAKRWRYEAGGMPATTRADDERARSR